MATSFTKNGKNMLTTGQGAGGVPGSITFENYGGGQFDNALRANHSTGALKKGETNPYFPKGGTSTGKLTTGGNTAFNASFGNAGSEGRSWGDGNATDADRAAFFGNVDKPEATAFNSAFSSSRAAPDQAMYDDFTDKAYAHATRTLDPTFDRARKDFDQRAINQGIATGTDAYNEEFDRYMREKNDAYSTAAFGAMGYGAERMDADRGYNENNYRFDTGLAEDNRRYDQQFGLNELTTMEGLGKTYRDENYRDAVFNSQQDQQQFNNLFQMQSLVPGTNYTAPNTANAFSNAQDAAIYNDRSNSALWTGVGNTVNDLATGVDWSKLWSSFSNPTNTTSGTSAGGV